MKPSSNTPSPATQPLQVLHEHIEREAPWLYIVRCVAHPHPFIEVKDTSNLNIHVSFSTEVELALYIQVVRKGAHHPPAEKPVLMAGGKAEHTHV